MRRIAEKYHKAATEAHVKVVPCCGFDSIPSDIGVHVLVNYMQNKLNK